MKEEVVKIFKLNNCDWYAAEDIESAIQQIMKHTGNTREDCVDSSAHALTDEEMDRLCFMDDRENGQDDEYGSRSFRAQLAIMIERGDAFPRFFASTEF